MAEILDPEIVICDSHQHLRGHYTLADYRSDIASGHRVEKAVHVECLAGYRVDGPEAFRPVGETELVIREDPNGLIAGIVGFAELRAPEISDVLAAHIQAGSGRFRGIRQASSWHPDPEIPSNRSNCPPRVLEDPAFRAGLAAVGRAGLSFDAWLYHVQIHELTEVARALPELSIILEHLGGPLCIGPYRDHREEMLDVWRTEIGALASCPNVAIKLGGIGMRIFGTGWEEKPKGATSAEIVTAWRPEFLYCIERFGADRCMFESNFPVDKDAFSYDTIWNAYKQTVSGASAAEKEALFHGTAERIYRL